MEKETDNPYTVIAESVRLIRDELSAYLISQQGDDPSRLIDGDVVLDNVAMLEGEDNADLTNKVMISLVNVEEESTLKNSRNYIHNPLSGGVSYVQPPVYINLYILVSSIPRQEPRTDAYELALNRLSLVIEFFQSKRRFTLANSPNAGALERDGTISPQMAEIRLLPELYTLTFEQLNHLWGSLGGKQIPSVMYKIRLVKIQQSLPEEASLIENPQGNLNPTN